VDGGALTRPVDQAALVEAGLAFEPDPDDDPPEDPDEDPDEDSEEDDPDAAAPEPAPSAVFPPAPSAALSFEAPFAVERLSVR
jgi:hypothetical protein